MRHLVAIPLVCSAIAAFARSQGYTIHQLAGTAPYDALGTGVGAAGDVDGDGTPDVVVGIPGRDAGGLGDAGEARVYSGANGTVLVVVAGAAAGDFLGISVAGVGDVDGDGAADFLVGANQEGSGGPGFARVHSGVDGSVLHAFAGLLAGDRFGSAVAAAGLVNLDTIPDVVVGAPRTGSGAGPGYARVFSGVNGGLIFHFSGNGVGDRFGDAVAPAGDINGDARADVFVGAPYDSTGNVEGGHARILSGANGTPLAGYSGSQFYGHLGTSVANAGLVNADSVPDRIIGTRGSLGALGAAHVYSGQGGATLVSVSGLVVGEMLGHAVAGAGGDLNADGFGDVLVGAPGSAIYNLPGVVRLISGATQEPILTMSGAASGDEFGWSMASIGDATADGLPELIVGAPGADPAGIPGAGIARVISVVGVPPGSTAFGTGCATPSGSVPVLTTSGGFPTSGALGPPAGNPNFGALVANAPPGKPVLLMLGSSSTSWLGASLPMDLAPLGLPGCSLLVGPLATSVGVTVGSGASGGKVRFPIPIPANPVLFGAEVFLQAYVVDPGPAPIPGATTRAIHVVVI